MPLSLFRILGRPLPTRGPTHAILRKLSGLTIVSESFELDVKDQSFLVYFHIVSYYCRVVFLQLLFTCRMDKEGMFHRREAITIVVSLYAVYLLSGIGLTCLDSYLTFSRLQT